VEDTQRVLIIRERVFEPFYAAVNDKPDGRAHQNSAREVHNVGPKHEHFNFSFLFWIKIGFLKETYITLLRIIRQQKKQSRSRNVIGRLAYRQPVPNQIYRATHLEFTPP
jgi:hypothetical protein